MKICPQCKTVYDNKFKFCKKCGVSLEVKTVNEKPVWQVQRRKESTDYWVWIIVALIVIAVAGVGFYHFNNKVRTLENEVKTQKTITKSINNATLSKNVKEEVEKEVRAAIDINAQKKQSAINNNVSVPYESNIVSVDSPGYILGDDVNVRSEPTINSKVIAVVNRGFRFHILSYVNDWAKVESGDGRIGYVYRKYISPNGTDVDWSKGDKYGKHAYSGVVKATEVNMRSSNSINSSIIGKFWQGENVKILGFYKEWVKVKRSNGQIGYIMRSYLEY